MTARLGIDVGGTKIAMGIVDDMGVVRRRASLLVADHPRPLDLMTEQARSLVAGTGMPVVSAGVGLPGPLDRTGERVAFAPNLPGIDDPALRSRLSSSIGLPVTLANDANAAAWAEHRFGAGRGASSMLFVCLGTGVGGAVVLDGRLWKGHTGAAGELGHMVIDPRGPRCGCGRDGCFEQAASGRALDRLARDRGFHDARTLSAAAAEGDSTADAALDRHARTTAHGLAALTITFDPGIVVLGGGVVTSENRLAARVNDALQALQPPGSHPAPEVRAAALGNDAGIVGAAHLAAA